ncbi:DUF3821 domain-containing protein [Methanospirillum stamsii]|uniref:PKD domain-containing protein n=1 Tax=Methanospirillum stamsii TaxID=1277351 RepID=A0A2V2NII1_9EURY|nr:DUF3821 domain-containing protein [Methanospirillum stamsii]PWR76237.1 hypothetical protein DLD82_00025 [Methanospirillum stamsii]
MNITMKGIGFSLLILLLFSCMSLTAAEDVEIKQLVPMFLTGTLYIDDDPASPGLVVTAMLNETVAGTATVISDGVYGSDSQPMMVQAGADETLEGEPVSFYVNGVQCEETILYERGVNRALDLHVSGAALNMLTVVPKGGDVFLGEQGLDISKTLGSGNMVAWKSGTGSYSAISITSAHSYYINPATFDGKLGNWYQWDGANAGDLAFVVNDPSIAFRVWNQNEKQYIASGGKISSGDFANFRIDTNLDSVIQQRGEGLPVEDLGIIDINGYSNVSSENYLNLRGTLSGIPDVDISIKDLAVDADSWYWPENDDNSSGWNTGALNSDGKRRYINGEYGFSAVVDLNNLKENYDNFYGVIVGKTETSTSSLNIVDESVDVIVNPGDVTRNSSFYVTVGGKPNKDYIIVIMQCDPGVTDPTMCCAEKMSGAPCDRPPKIREDQSGVSAGTITFDDPAGTTFPIGDTKLSPDCCEKTGNIRDVVPTDDKPWASNVYANGVYYYAKVLTNTTGYQVVEFTVGSDVAPDRSYRIHVQSVEETPESVIDGDGMVKVNKGVVTMDIKEEAPYYLGNDVTLSGTNTDSDKVYLFMTGPCQNGCGNDLLGWKTPDAEENIIQPGLDMVELGCKEESDQFTAIEVPVKSDGTWSYTWKTEKAPINPATYTIFAASQPINACCLDCACAATTSRTIIFEEPCFDAVLDPQIVELPVGCCPNGCSWTDQDAIMLTGTACGFPHTGDGENVTKEINMWIFGKEKVGNDKYVNARIPVYCDDTFEINLLNYISLCDLKPGEYSIILQHPMYNHKFDMVKETDVRTPIEGNRIWMVTSYPDEWSKLFPLEGQGYYEGEKAVKAITDFLDERLVDDKYIVLPLTIVNDGVPTADFSGTPTQGGKPLEVQFTDKSVGKDLNQWSWSFGDGTISTEVNPKHTYSDDGVYTVSLTVMNKEGLEDTVTKTDYITVREPKISADFIGSPTSGASPLNVKFTDKSTGEPTNWFWDFGDGYTSAGVQNPSHTYTFGGKYTVTLTVTLGDEMDRETKTDYITVIGGPQPTPTIGPYDPTKVQLFSGWNFISVARTLSDATSNASVVFKDVPTGGHAIWAYDPYKQYWDQVLTGTEITPLYGYWIYSVTPYTINLQFKNDPVSAPPTRSLPSGWAAIGFTGGTPATAKDTLKSVKDGWIYTRGYDAQHQQWESTIVNGGQGENTYLFPSKGYWLYMETPGTLAAIGV